MENHQNKVLLDCRFWGPGHTGLGRYTQELSAAMRRLKPGLELIFLTPKLSEIKPYSWQEQRDLTRIIETYQPQLTHFLHFNVPLNFSGPFVVTIHDLIKHHSRGLATTTHWAGAYWFKRLGYYLTVKKAVTRSRHIFVPSNWVKKDILDHYAVDKNKITVTAEAAKEIYFQAGRGQVLPYDYFIYVGNAYPHKNVIQLIKAVQIVARDNPGVKLVIVTGRDWFYQKLRGAIAKLKAQSAVKLKDFTNDADLARLYRGAKAFVTASLYEGFGLPGLEAMASGTLVLASRRAALPETYGRNAEYFNPENLEEIVARMKSALTLPPAARAKKIAAAQTYCRQFSWSQTAQKTVEVYESLLGV